MNQNDQRQTPQVLLCQLMQEHGLSQSAVASAVGLARQAIHEIVHGRRKVTVDISLRLEKLFGVPAADWALLQFEEDRKELISDPQVKKSLDNIKPLSNGTVEAGIVTRQQQDLMLAFYDGVDAYREYKEQAICPYCEMTQRILHASWTRGYRAARSRDFNTPKSMTVDLSNPAIHPIAKRRIEEYQQAENEGRLAYDRFRKGERVQCPYSGIDDRGKWEAWHRGYRVAERETEGFGGS